MNDAIFWLIVGAVFGVIEGITVGLYSIWFVGGALAAALVAVLGFPLFPTQTMAFLIVSLGLIVTTRPLLKKKFDKKIPKTNAETLIGTEAVVVKSIPPHTVGEVKVDDKYWRAKSNDTVLDGERVIITELNGVTVTVERTGGGK